MVSTINACCLILCKQNEKLENKWGRNKGTWGCNVSLWLLTGIFHGFYVLALVWQLVLQWSVGVWVIARCVLNRTQLEEDIMNKLGGCFTVVPFLIIVVSIKFLSGRTLKYPWIFFIIPNAPEIFNISPKCWWSTSEIEKLGMSQLYYSLFHGLSGAFR